MCEIRRHDYHHDGGDVAVVEAMILDNKYWPSEIRFGPDRITELCLPNIAASDSYHDVRRRTAFD